MIQMIKKSNIWLKYVGADFNGTEKNIASLVKVMTHLEPFTLTVKGLPVDPGDMNTIRTSLDGISSGNQILDKKNDLTVQEISDYLAEHTELNGTYSGKLKTTKDMWTLTVDRESKNETPYRRIIITHYKE